MGTDKRPAWTKEEIQELKMVFEIFDIDKDGKVTYKELGKVMKYLGKKFADKELKEMIKNVDVNGNGVIDFSEFLQMMLTATYSILSDKELLAAFKVFDKNSDGVITVAELQDAMMNLGDKMTLAEATEMLRAADSNGDGVINYLEFVVMMQRKNQKSKE